MYGIPVYCISGGLGEGASNVHAQGLNLTQPERTRAAYQALDFAGLDPFLRSHPRGLDLGDPRRRRGVVGRSAPVDRLGKAAVAGPARRDPDEPTAALDTTPETTLVSRLMAGWRAHRDHRDASRADPVADRAHADPAERQDGGGRAARCGSGASDQGQGGGGRMTTVTDPHGVRGADPADERTIWMSAAVTIGVFLVWALGRPGRSGSCAARRDRPSSKPQIIQNLEGGSLPNWTWPRATRAPGHCSAKLYGTKYQT